MAQKRSGLDIFGTVLGMAGLAAAGSLAGAAAFFYKFALVPKKHDPRLDLRPLEKDYAAGRSWMNGHVRRQDVFILSDNGLQLHGNYIKASNPDCHRYAICVHGYADSAESMGLYARRYYEEYGMNVLLPDLRGHGASEGSYVGMGYHDCHDLQRWINFILQMDAEAVIILHGISMGAATVCMATGLTLPKQVLAAISDAAYTSAMEVFSSVYRGLDNAFIPAPVMLQLVRLICFARAHYDLAKASPLKSVAASETPTLFIHGEDDDFVPADMMPRLFEAASCKKDFLWIPGARHVQSVVMQPEVYWKKVESFLDDISPWILHDNIKDIDPFSDDY